MKIPRPTEVSNVAHLEDEKGVHTVDTPDDLSSTEVIPDEVELWAREQMARAWTEGWNSGVDHDVALTPNPYVGRPTSGWVWCPSCLSWQPPESCHATGTL